jgi:predicted DNA-binding antitoxin AbrB/MazE fold protein
MRKLEAVYEGGVLRPTEKLPLEEHQLVSVVILDAEADEETVEFESPESFQALADHSISREAVRAALATIPGSLDGDFAAERNER